jgi:hypothetical protein
MAQRCSVCSRVNPDEARYCYHDGAVLAGGNGYAGPVAVGSQSFPSPFVFPSGRACRTFDELVLGCEADWEGARDILRRGYLEGFLAATGRADLAAVARKASGETDIDRALDELLSKLPGDIREGPQLRVEPMEVNLGRVPRGEDRQFDLLIENQGMGLLSGAVTVSGAPWLLLGEGMGAPRKVFQCRSEFRLPVRVNSRALRANVQPAEGKLIVSCSGGSAIVNVRVEVPVVPFPDGPLAGATSPRQLASKAKADPKKAAPYFEKGAVATWYENNGWTYPVQGPSSSGLGAIQQFFEALGLVTPPKVEISERSVHLYGSPGEALERVLVLQAAEPRPVFAHATTGVPWLRIGRIQLEGRTARVPLRIPEVPSRPGELLTGKVLVQSNGNQRFVVQVSLGVLGTSKARPTPAPATRPPTAAPAPTPAPVAAPPAPARPSHGLPAYLSSPPPQRQAPPTAQPTWPAVPGYVVVEAPETVRVPPAQMEAVLPAPEQELAEVLPAAVEVAPQRREPILDVLPASPHDEVDRRRRSREIAPAVLVLPFVALVFALLATLLHDLLLPADTDAAAGPIDPTPVIAVRFHDGPKEEGGAAIPMPMPTMRFGVVMLGEKDPARPGHNKRLTFDEWGRSNNTCIRIDKQDVIFGQQGGTWVEREQPLGEDISGRKRDGLASVWEHTASRVIVTQEVEVVPGEQSRKLDTCLIRYILENRDRQQHRAGIRFMLDTFIGANDGVPFTIPSATGLCDTSRVFATAPEVPDFIEALEKDDLLHPGTVAHLQLRLGGQIEAPSRVTLGGWPNLGFQQFHQKPEYQRAHAQNTLWDVPVVGMRELDELARTMKPPQSADPDSAVVMYWGERLLPAGERRVVGFAYGLGTVSSAESGGRLLLTVGGQLVKNGEFTLTALVANPVRGEHLTLELPSGFTLVSGTAEQPVPPVPAGAARAASPVTWRIRAGGDGRYELRVRSSEGTTQRVTVRIRTRGVFD